MTDANEINVDTICENRETICEIIMINEMEPRLNIMFKSKITFEMTSDNDKIKETGH